MFYQLVLFMVILAIALARPTWNELSTDYTFDHYVKDFAKGYERGTKEYLKREKLFTTELLRVLEHNRSGRTWKEGINHFSDLTEEEMQASKGLHRGLMNLQKLKQNRLASAPEDISLLAHLPRSVDWRDHNVVTAVKDQGKCGSCWTFATAELIESSVALATGELHDLSPQQIVSCAPNPDGCGGTGGCEGGTVQVAIDHITSVAGLASQWTYPYMQEVYYNSYTGSNGDCMEGLTIQNGQHSVEVAPAVVQLDGWAALGTNSYTDLMVALAQGPVAVSVDADFGSYEEGIYDGCDASAPLIDHAVVAVGYGEEDGVKYWIIRNSWSASWGEDGYIRLLRRDIRDLEDHLPVCGQDPDPSMGTACEGDYDTNITVCGTCGVLYDNVIAKGVYTLN
jgi:cathepsin L